MSVAIHAASSPLAATAFVAGIDAAGIDRVRREVRALGEYWAGPLTLDLAYVSTSASEEALAPLAAIEGPSIRVTRRRLASRAARRAPGHDRHVEPSPPIEADDRHVEPGPISTDDRHVNPRPIEARDQVSSPDPFGLDSAFHARWLPLLGFLADHYWRITTDGLEHVPDEGPVLIAANHSGAVPADAAMLAATLALRHPARRTLRVLYDRFVDQLPWIASFYRRFGAVPASLANAQALLARREAVGLFPEGVHGLEKTCREGYRLRPFRSGTARLALRTGSPIVPVAIVGAAEAYPLVVRLYRAGDLIGVPWIPVTPLFPLCGIAGALPLPTKWYIRFARPIVPSVDPAPDEHAVHALTTRLHDAIDDTLDALLASRRGVFR